MASNGKSNAVSVCPGPIKRREFLRIGLSGFATLSLPGLFELRARAAIEKPKARTAVILVWLRGGASHLETYDPKPDAPSEFRGVFSPISTRVPGMQISELLPRHAKIADKFTLLRSMTHTGGGHPAGSLQMLTGDPDPQDKDKPIFPDWMTVANFLRADRTRPLPNYVGVNPVTRYDNFTIAGPAYVGPSYGPFTVNGDPNDPHFAVPNIGFKDQAQSERLSDRIRLKQSLDRLDRAVDQSGTMRAIDDFEAQALSLLTSPGAREAFDLSREPDRIRDLYGRNQWGQQCLMARRLVEAGVEIVTTTFDGPLCGRVANWDDHAVNHNVFDALKFRAPYFDQAVSALIEDIYARGLDKRVLVVVTGEFGRTPRIERVASSGGGVASGAAGTVQPGRDHWPRAFSNLWAGGGIKTGGVIGATDKHGEEVVSRMCTPGDFLATIYRHLGIDAGQITIPDFSGRPNLVLPRGAPISELERQS
ncbi:MAG TPA: DUF1501 domain-containing protein [Verrucomicrobiae bacterium]|nr:DUF1501 domain-containing protein [Verrucomicrobiae bacterium]